MQLSSVGGVEFLSETYSHSMASLKNKDEFKRQTEAHANKMEELFGRQPSVLKYTELIYSKKIGELAAELGFKAVLTEDNNDILQGKSPNHLYCNPTIPGIIILFKNSQQSNEIAFRLSNPGWTGSSQKLNNSFPFLNNISDDEKIINLIIDYEIVGKCKKKKAKIYDIVQTFTQVLFEMKEYGFKTPSEIAEEYQSVSEVNIPDSVSGADKTVNPTVLLGNELQQEALEKLYDLKGKVDPYTDLDLWKDWQYLQSSDHFYYMSSVFFTHGDGQHNFNPYDNPYEAFMNYMNVLSDFRIRLNSSSARKNDYNPGLMQSDWKNTVASNYA